MRFSVFPVAPELQYDVMPHVPKVRSQSVEGANIYACIRRPRQILHEFKQEQALLILG